jgi:hypothetical protein
MDPRVRRLTGTYERFTEETGFQLPAADDASFWENRENPQFLAWLEARYRWNADHYRRLRADGQDLAAAEVGLELASAHLMRGELEDTGALLDEVLAQPLEGWWRMAALGTRMWWSRYLGDWAAASSTLQESFDQALATDDPAVHRVLAQTMSFELLFTDPGLPRARLTSLSADIHKYGWCFKGASVLFQPDPSLLQNQLLIFDRWPGGVYGSGTTARARPGAPECGVLVRHPHHRARWSQGGASSAPRQTAPPTAAVAPPLQALRAERALARTVAPSPAAFPLA